MISIGTLSRRTGVNIETIRYYERTGVLPKAQRASNGRRCYDDGDVRRLGFVRHARGLGFEMSAIRALLALQQQPNAPCSIASKLAADQLAAVESRIARLKELKKELSRIVSLCDDGPVADCRIIEALIGSPKKFKHVAAPAGRSRPARRQ